uniref:Uncharacterized protein n=1 Tax=Lactuca sativa TaxID=4236 RepID=A0A9R1VAT9_LACSA|nr:hypothetical protein LSAT_V11C600332650 [Lactuca sativa]
MYVDLVVLVLWWLFAKNWKIFVQCSPTRHVGMSFIHFFNPKIIKEMMGTAMRVQMDIVFQKAHTTLPTRSLRLTNSRIHGDGSTLWPHLQSPAQKKASCCGELHGPSKGRDS